MFCIARDICSPHIEIPIKHLLFKIGREIGQGNFDPHTAPKPSATAAMIRWVARGKEALSARLSGSTVTRGFPRTRGQSCQTGNDS